MASDKAETPPRSDWRGFSPELTDVLTLDAANRGVDDLGEVIALLCRDPAAFVRIYFLPVPVVEMEQNFHGTTFIERRFPWPLGAFSATSR